jgi:hypothetical protein
MTPIGFVNNVEAVRNRGLWVDVDNLAYSANFIVLAWYLRIEHLFTSY